MTSKPCPPSLNKIPICCNYYEPCTSECEDEEYVGTEEGGWEDVDEGDGQARSAKRRCWNVPKKRLKPCIRRSQIPGAKPLQQFEEKRPCRKLHPKPCRRRSRRNKRTEGELHPNDEEEEEGDEENLEGECESGGDGSVLGEEINGEENGKESNDGNDEYYKGGEILGRKGPCRKKGRRKPMKRPCRRTSVTFPEDESPLFPSLPIPNLGEKPPEQKFPPAEDKISADKKRVFPCRSKKKRLKPCRRRGGSSNSSSSCTTSSSDED